MSLRMVCPLTLPNSNLLTCYYNLLLAFTQNVLFIPTGYNDNENIKIFLWGTTTINFYVQLGIGPSSGSRCIY